ncbi:MAG: hypothetical protein WB706_10955, partial [Nitrososphaeraceae archaeon]
KYDLSFEIRIVILVTPRGKKLTINSQEYCRGKLANINEVFAQAFQLTLVALMKKIRPIF